MIIVKLKGGLGNQMFQYAFGRALSIKYKTDYKLDLSWFSEQNLRVYELGYFQINAQIATKREISFFKETPATFIEKIKHTIYRPILFNETGFEYNQIKLESKNCFFDGYWQSYKYFQEFSKTIKNDFSPVKKIEKKNIPVNSVAIHFRRQDYLDENKPHGICNKSYYIKAIDRIYQKVENPLFYVFSDDIKWVKKNWEFLSNPIFIERKNAIEEFCLMSACSHFIIANSTFSWWAAWLADFKEKTIIAPIVWFKKEGLNGQTDDLIPKNWKRI